MTGSGFHVPGLAVSVLPTAAVPETVGLGVVVRSAAGTGAVGSETFVAGAWPSFVPVTATVRVVPPSTSWTL